MDSPRLDISFILNYTRIATTAQVELDDRLIFSYFKMNGL